MMKVSNAASLKQIFSESACSSIWVWHMCPSYRKQTCPTTIRVTNKMTPQDVGNEVYLLIRQEMCAEGGSDQLYSCVLPCCEKL